MLINRNSNIARSLAIGGKALNNASKRRPQIAEGSTTVGVPAGAILRCLLFLGVMPALLHADILVAPTIYGDVSELGTILGVDPASSLTFVGTDHEEYGRDWRSFWLFQLPGAGSISSASFEFQPRVYFGGATSDTVAFTAFALSPSVLNGTRAVDDPIGMNIYDAIGSGTSYGQLTVHPEDGAILCRDNFACPDQIGNLISFELNAVGLAAINANLGGTLVIGAYLATDPGPLVAPSVGGVQFDFLASPRSKLDLTVAPEPSSFGLIAAAGLLALGCRGVALRRRGNIRG